MAKPILALHRLITDPSTTPFIPNVLRCILFRLLEHGPVDPAPKARSFKLVKCLVDTILLSICVSTEFLGTKAGLFMLVRALAGTPNDYRC